MSERDGYQHGVPCWVDTWQPDADAAAAFYAGIFGWEVRSGSPGGTETRYDLCTVQGSDVAAIGAPRVNEPSAYAMSLLHTPDTAAAAAFYADLFGWTTEAFGPATMFRLPGFVGAQPTQP